MVGHTSLFAKPKMEGANNKGAFAKSGALSRVLHTAVKKVFFRTHFCPNPGSRLAIRVLFFDVQTNKYGYYTCAKA